MQLFAKKSKIADVAFKTFYLIKYVREINLMLFTVLFIKY